MDGISIHPLISQSQLRIILSSGTLKWYLLPFFPLCSRMFLPTSKWVCLCAEYSQWIPKGSWSSSKPKAIKHRMYQTVADVVVSVCSPFLSDKHFFLSLSFYFTDITDWVSWWSMFFLYEVHNKAPPSAAQSSAPSVTGESPSLTCVWRSCFNSDWC